MSSSTEKTVAETYDALGKNYSKLTMPIEGNLLERRRRGLLAHARGKVLEVGIADGKNLSYYPQGVTHVVGVDLSQKMLDASSEQARGMHYDFEPYLGDATHLPFDDHSFDVVAGTLVGCIFADPVAGYRELRRLVRRDGHILLLEHTMTTGLVNRAILSAVSGYAKRVLSCDSKRDNLRFMREAGLKIEQLDQAFFDILLTVVARA